VTDDEITYLERLADRLSIALYHDKVGPVGLESSGLRHDDYDRLRAIARAERGVDGQFARDLKRSTLPWESRP
jgi:hypothetical protein